MVWSPSRLVAVVGTHGPSLVGGIGWVMLPVGCLDIGLGIIWVLCMVVDILMLERVLRFVLAVPLVLLIIILVGVELGISIIGILQVGVGVSI